jgi:hypothetical protein
MAATGHHPKGRSRNRAIHLDGHFDWIEGIAISIDDQCGGRNSRQSRGREVHVVIAVLHPAHPLPQRHDLLIAELVSLAHRLPFLSWLVFCVRNLSHDRSGLLRKIHRRGDENHRFNARWLQRRHVKQNISPHAQSDGPTFLDAKMIQEREGIERTFFVRDRLAGIGRSTVATCVRFDEGVLASEVITASVDPIFLATSAAMQKQERVSGALCLIVHFDIADVNALGPHNPHYVRRQPDNQSGYLSRGCLLNHQEEFGEHTSISIVQACSPKRLLGIWKPTEQMRGSSPGLPVNLLIREVSNGLHARFAPNLPG